MAIYLYRLRFTGPIHFGVTGIGLENSDIRLRSDGVTSALINAFAVLDEADDAVAALRAERPAFVLSSLFPYGTVDSGPPIFTLPRPMVAPPLKEPVRREQAKELKQLRWLTPTQTSRWLNGPELGTEELGDILDHARSIGRGWWKDDLHPRVALDRDSQNSQIWLCGTITFAEGCGLYGLIQVNDESWMPRLEAAFRVLGDMGIGGERTYGMGLFRFQGFEVPASEWDPLLKAHTSRRILLSAYHPTEAERATLPSPWKAWEFFESRGYITTGRMATTLKRKRVRFLAEGSVATHPVRGDLADVTPNIAPNFGITHRIYRSGLAFIVPA